MIKVIKRSPVSTGKLKPFQALHFQPINLVVYQEAHVPKDMES